MGCDLALSFQAYKHIAARLCWSLPLDGSYVRRPVSPVAADFATRHDMHVEMRCGLTGNYAVVLDQVKPIWVVCSHKGISDSADRVHDGDRIVVRQVERRRSVAPGENQDLPMLKLGWVNQGHGLVGLLNSNLLLATGDDFTSKAGSVGRRSSSWRDSGPGGYLDWHGSTPIYRISESIIGSGVRPRLAFQRTAPGDRRGKLQGHLVLRSEWRNRSRYL